MEPSEYEKLWAETHKALVAVNTLIEEVDVRTPRMAQLIGSCKRLSDALLKELELLWTEYNNSSKE